MMRLVCVTALALLLTACQIFEIRTDGPDELTRVVDFHQASERREDADLKAEVVDLRDALQQDTDAPAALQLRLLILETRLELRELQQAHNRQLQHIQALNAQIRELTAIEQQINRRGQQLETVNE